MTASVQQFLEDFHSDIRDDGALLEDATESPFSVSVLFQQPHLYILLRGELEFHHIDRFNKAVDVIISEPTCKEIVVDMGGVTFVDSTGLACLVKASQTVKERGGRIYLAACTSFVLKTLEITRLKRVFVVHDTFQSAYDAAQESGGAAS